MATLALVGTVLLKAILPGLATAAGTLLVALLKRQLDRAGIARTNDLDEQLRRLVETAIVQVEEVARRQFLEGGERLAPEDKRKEAVVRVMAERPDLSAWDIEPLIDAILPKVRQMLPATTLPKPAPAPELVARRH